MDLVIEDSGGANIVAREMGEPEWYEPATVDAYEVEVSFQEIDPGTGALIGAPRRLGRFPAEGKIVFTDNPDTDRDARLYFVPYAADGTPAVSDLRDALQMTVFRRRETEAPEIGLTGNATEDTAEIGIKGFGRFARERRVTVCADEAMSEVLKEILLDLEYYGARELPKFFTLSRFLSTTLSTQGNLGLEMEDGEQTLILEDSGAVLPATVYVTVAHSGGNGWTPESNVLEVTFAGGGTPGTPGDFDAEPRDGYRFGLGEV